MPDLTLVLTGPNTTDIRIFADGYRLGGLQTIDFSVNSQDMIPSIAVKFPFVRMWQEEIPKGDGYVTIRYESGISSCSKFMVDRMITVGFGNYLLGRINKLSFSADVAEKTHTLTLEYKRVVIETDEASDLRKMLYDLPDWINVVIQE